MVERKNHQTGDACKFMRVKIAREHLSTAEAQGQINFAAPQSSNYFRRRLVEHFDFNLWMLAPQYR